MRNVTRWAAAGVVALGMVGMFGLAALAQQGPVQGRPDRPWGPDPRANAMALGFALGQLDLTEAQREQVHAILQQHREESRALMGQARAARRAVNEAVEAATPDEAAIRAASANLAEAETQMALMRARVRSEVLQVLTPEQRATAEALTAQRVERARQRRAQRPALPQ